MGPGGWRGGGMAGIGYLRRGGCFQLNTPTSKATPSSSQTSIISPTPPPPCSTSSSASSSPSSPFSTPSNTAHDILHIQRESPRRPSGHRSSLPQHKHLQPTGAAAQMPTGQPRHGLNDWLENIRNEFDALANEINVVRNQRDDFENKCTLMCIVFDRPFSHLQNSDRASE